MSSEKITFDDKVSTITSPLPEINRITAANVNEIKSVVNAHADRIDALTLTTMVTNATNSLSAGALATASGNKTMTNAGYMPVAVTGVISNDDAVDLTGFYISDIASGTCKVNYKFYNKATSAKTPTITMYVSWIKI